MSFFCTVIFECPGGSISSRQQLDLRTYVSTRGTKKRFVYLHVHKTLLVSYTVYNETLVVINKVVWWLKTCKYNEVPNRLTLLIFV